MEITTETHALPTPNGDVRVTFVLVDGLTAGGYRPSPKGDFQRATRNGPAGCATDYYGPGVERWVAEGRPAR